MWKSFKRKVAAWIPEHVSPKFVVWAYMLLDLICIVRKPIIRQNFIHNSEHIAKNDTPLRGGYIENQNEWGNIHFGKTTMAFAGCEVFAIYNIFRALGKGEGPQKILELIEDFEKKGASLQGWMGTSPMALKRYISKHGIQNRLVWKADNLNNPRLAIVTVYNNKKDLYSQIHTVAFTKEEDGYVAHNANCGHTGCEYLKDAINHLGTDPKLICAIEIRE